MKHVKCSHVKGRPELGATLETFHMSTCQMLNDVLESGRSGAPTRVFEIVAIGEFFWKILHGPEM